MKISCKPGALLVAVFVVAPLAAQPQLSSSAYRVLGQPDFRHDGVNGVRGVELFAPAGVALSPHGAQLRLFIADTQNHRVLAWSDTSAYQNGDAPALVLGQPDFSSSNPMGLGYKGLNGPAGLAVQPSTGDLYVADTNNSRVLRFADPFANPTRIEPNAVYGQPGFQSLSGNSTGLGKASLRGPQSLAFDADGNLWIADTGNNRVLRIPAANLNADKTPEADVVLGQPDFLSSSPNGTGQVTASTLYNPMALAFDAQGALFIADYNNARVVKYQAPAAANAAASAVFGQANLTSRTVPVQATESSMPGPMGISVGPNGLLYVAVPFNHRILVFDTSQSGSPAKTYYGQPGSISVDPDAGVFPLASDSSLYAVSDVKVDSGGNVYLADTGNNRVLEIPRSSVHASRVWGQPDFRYNGANQTKPGSIRVPYKQAVDYSHAPFPLYVSDSGNHRVLVWRDSAHFHSGDDPDFVIGQPGLQFSAPNIDAAGKPSKTSLNTPRGIALDASGNLYVADSGNHRILRYPRPVDQSGRIAPDMVLGQPDFVTAETAAVNASSLHNPSGIAFGPNGDLFVSDAGNNRVLEFPAGAGLKTSAIRVYGQPDFTSASVGSAPTSQTLSSPQGIAVDGAYNLYVADFGFNRVLVFSNTRDAAAANAVASTVLGQDKFTTATSGLAANRMRGPADVALDSSAGIYVADALNSRVLVFPSLVLLPNGGGAAVGAIGQPSFTSSTPNWDAAKPDNITVGFASARGLYVPQGLFVDRQDTLYVGDSGNNRVVHFLNSMDAANVVGTTQATAPGGIASAFGANFAGGAETASSASLPFSLGGREVSIEDSLPAALYYVSPGQINFQVPSAAPAGTLRMALRQSDTGELIASGSLGVVKAAPALFATVLNENNTPNSTANPALKGSVIQIYGVGQGEVSPAVSDGWPASANPVSQTVARPTSDGATCLNSQPSMCVAVGNAFGEVVFSGLTPGLVGVWQINVKVPPNALSGAAVPVRVVINGSSSNLITIGIK